MSGEVSKGLKIKLHQLHGRESVEKGMSISLIEHHSGLTAALAKAERVLGICEGCLGGWTRIFKIRGLL